MKDSDLYQLITGSPHFNAGDMERQFKKFRSSRDLTSYDELLDIPFTELQSSTIADLPSGSGPITQKFTSNPNFTGNIIAIDFNADELSIIPKSDRLTTYCAAAQSLPLASNSVDYIFCHLGLMLFSPLEKALKEMSRVLFPEGKLIANLIGQTNDPIFNTYASISSEFECQINDFLGWGDRAIDDINLFENVLDATGFCTPTHCSEYTISYQSSLDEVIESASVFFQVHYMITDSVREHYFNKLKAGLAKYVSDDEIGLSIPFKKLIITNKNHT